MRPCINQNTHTHCIYMESSHAVASLVFPIQIFNYANFISCPVVTTRLSNSRTFAVGLLSMMKLDSSPHCSLPLLFANSNSDVSAVAPVFFLSPSEVASVGMPQFFWNPGLALSFSYAFDFHQTAPNLLHLELSEQADGAFLTHPKMRFVLYKSSSQHWLKKSGKLHWGHFEISLNFFFLFQPFSMPSSFYEPFTL